MKVRGNYRLLPEDGELVRRTFLKGVGASTLVLVLVAINAVLTRRHLTEIGALIVDGVAVVALITLVHTYSRTMAMIRLGIARRSHSQDNPQAVMAALLPYLGGGWLNNKSRFDKDGEAHYLLTWAASRLDEPEVLRYSTAFLVKFRRGSWTKKAVKIATKYEQKGSFGSPKEPQATN